MKFIGVVGAGTMGSGIAHVLSLSGYEVMICDMKKEMVEKAHHTIATNFRRLVEKGKLREEVVRPALGRIQYTTELTKMAEAELVVEAIVEKVDAKKTLFNQLDTICNPSTVLASNTSGLSITEIASATHRPDRVIGMHFFNPVPVMKLVEIVLGEATSDETLHSIKGVVEHLGKVSIIVKDAPLFVVNRILLPMINEAIFVFSENTASAEHIDLGMKLGANHPIGPLALADLIGLDTLLLSIDSLYKKTGNEKYKPCPLLVQLVEEGKLGRKSGQGFYTYP